MDDAGPSLIGALRDHLQQELNLHRQLINVAQHKHDEIVSGQIGAFSRLLQEEQRHLEKGQELRLHRERLMRNLATHIGTRPEKLHMAQILERAEEPLRSELKGLQTDLRGLLINLREVNDRNMLLIRQSLSLVRDVMDIVLGQSGAQGYDRSGSDHVAGERATGSLFKFEA